MDFTCCGSLQTISEGAELERETSSSASSSQKDDGNDDGLNLPKIKVGDRLGDRYKVIQQLGYGNYGLVVKGLDLKYRSNVAVKVFREGPNYDMIAKHESYMLTYLKHKDKGETCNIVRFYESFKAKKYTCLVFEMLGNDLENFRRKHGLVINRNVVKPIIKSVLNGLEFLHENEIIHADLKPANIALRSSETYECKILDFGKCFFSKYAHTQNVIQPTLYRAPEVFLRAPITNKIDIWSVGIITLELVKGWVVLFGENDVEQMMNYVSYFGFPSHELLSQSKNASSYFSVTPKEITLLVTPGQEQVQPRSKTLERTLRIKNDPIFIDFLKKCLAMDPVQRPSATQALQHPWFDDFRSCELSDELSLRNSRNRLLRPSSVPCTIL